MDLRAEDARSVQTMEENKEKRSLNGSVGKSKRSRRSAEKQEA